MGIEASGIAAARSVPAGCYFSGNPILDLELAERPDCFVAVTTGGAVPSKVAHNVQLLRANTEMDFVFIFLYWLVFTSFAFTLSDGLPKWMVIGLISVAALLDVGENLEIFKGLGSVVSSSTFDGLLPRDFSFLKWVCLGVNLIVLAVVLWTRKGRLYRGTTIALLVSGALTLMSLAIPHVMIYTTYGFLLSFLFILARVFPYEADDVLLWIEYAYLLRFQIFLAAVLVLALPLSYRFAPSLFVGVFDARGFTSFVFVVWAAFQLAWVILVTSRLVFVYGPDRFLRATSIAPKRVGVGLVTAFGSLALPVVIILFVGTSAVISFGKVLATAVGLLLAVAVLALTASLHFAIEDPGNSANLIFPSFGFLTRTARPKSAFWTFIGGYLSRHLPVDLQAGILDTTKTETPRFRSGHEMAVIALTVFAGLYLALGILFSPKWWNPDKEPAALFFVLLFLTVVTWLLSGAAFFLDRTRLPVFTTLLVVSLLTGVLGTDHKFTVMEKHSVENKISPSLVIERWKKTRGKNSGTIIVVATAGGGIRAAAWTAEVLTRLEEKGCRAVSDSLVLVSSVSGGSVGSMFVVAPYSGTGEYPSSDEDLRAIRFNTERSSLAAVGWGLAYPDLARTAPFLGGLVPQTLDRGWSLENTWATGWREKGLETPTLRQWREDVRNGSRPAVIFNATASESGERFLIASSDASFAGTKQFFALFPTKDLNVSTGARLSASFPYASPLAKASDGTVETGYHVGDGGYYDNSGLLSVVEWLDEARDNLAGYNVFLILIDAKAGNAKDGSSWSWQRQLVGPIQTLLNVRTSSQQVRESIELKMAVKYLRSRDATSAKPGLGQVIPEPFLFWSKNDTDPPLSWHLTDSQKREIRGAWASEENQQSWREIRSVLQCTVDADILRRAQENE